MSTMWVTDDGSYGTGAVMQFDTADWSEGDWEDFESAPDYYRLIMAIALDEKQERERGGE